MLQGNRVPRNGSPNLGSSLCCRSQKPLPHQKPPNLQRFLLRGRYAGNGNQRPRSSELQPHGLAAPSVTENGTCKQNTLSSFNIPCWSHEARCLGLAICKSPTKALRIPLYIHLRELTVPLWWADCTLPAVRAISPESVHVQQC